MFDRWKALARMGCEPENGSFECILQDLHTNRRGVPCLAHTLDADDGVGFLLVVEGERQRSRKFATTLEVRKRGVRWQRRGFLRSRVRTCKSASPLGV